MMRCTYFAACLLLAGCWETIPVANVPVPVPCLKPEDKPVRPKMATESELKAMNGYQRVLALEAHRIQSEAHIDKQAALIDVCSKLARP